MFFLVHYNRKQGRIVRITEYPTEQFDLANSDRLELEIALNQSGDSAEIVVLEAADRRRLIATHGRYFKGVQELAGEAAPETSDRP